MALGAHLGGLVLELGHPLRLAETGEAAEDPAELGVLGHLGLQEHRGSLPGRSLRRAAARRCAACAPAVPRLGRDGQRVQVGDPVERFMIVLQRHPLAQRTQEVAEVERVGGGLGQGEHARPAGPLCGGMRYRSSFPRSRAAVRVARSLFHCCDGRSESFTTADAPPAGKPSWARLGVKSLPSCRARRRWPPGGRPAR